MDHKNTHKKVHTKLRGRFFGKNNPMIGVNNGIGGNSMIPARRYFNVERKV